MEKWAYEMRPHFCLGFALYALTAGRSSAHPVVMAVCGLVLLFCGLLIFRMRSEYRTRTRK